MRENMDQKNFIFVHVSHSVKFWKPSRQLEKKNIVLVYKKGNKQLILMLSMLSLLSISSKIFDRLVFNSLYKLIEQTIFSALIINLDSGNQIHVLIKLYLWCMTLHKKLNFPLRISSVLRSFPQI